MGLFAWCGAATTVFLFSLGARAQSATGTFPPLTSTAPTVSAAPESTTPAQPPAPPSAAQPASAAAAPPVVLVPAAPPRLQPVAPYPYGQSYYYPSLPRRAARYAEDAAVRSSPFMDVTMASVYWQNRFSQFLTVGGQFGMYLRGRVRVAVNAVVPAGTLQDNFSYDHSDGDGDYVLVPSKDVSLIFGAEAGYVVLRSANFAFAPGLAFSHTNVANYGSALAFSLPFEWVTEGGLRVGLDFQGGRTFGGVYRVTCITTVTGTPSSCLEGPQIDRSRPSGATIFAQFQLGFGFNHPDPRPPSH